jgi:hypothetical protein
VTLWHNDGKTWSLVPGVEAGILPLSGYVRIVRDPEGVRLLHDGIEVIRVGSRRLPLHDGPLGIRWMGARVKPQPESFEQIWTT